RTAGPTAARGVGFAGLAAPAAQARRCAAAASPAALWSASDDSAEHGDLWITTGAIADPDPSVRQPAPAGRSVPRAGRAEIAARAAGGEAGVLPHRPQAKAGDAAPRPRRLRRAGCGGGQAARGGPGAASTAGGGGGGSGQAARFAGQTSGGER